MRSVRFPLRRYRIAAIAAGIATSFAALAHPTRAQEPGEESFIIEDTTGHAETAEPKTAEPKTTEPKTTEPKTTETDTTDTGLAETETPGTQATEAEQPEETGYILEEQSLDSTVEETYVPASETTETTETTETAETAETAAPKTEKPRSGWRSMKRYDPHRWFSAGLRLSYFHYAEIFPTDEVWEFLEHDAFGNEIDSIIGWPKSTEHGVCEGFELEMMQQIPGTPLFIRPRIGAALGLMHTYDGSTQAITDSIPGTAIYLPITDRKNNFFAQGAFHIGGGYLSQGITVLLFSGLHLRWWSRTFRGSSEEEYYYWADMPVGLILDVGLPKGWGISFEPQLAFMLGGRMQIAIDGPDIPSVRLSDNIAFLDRNSFRIAAAVRKRLAPLISLRLSPYFEYYHFEKSNEARLLEPTGAEWIFYEPASRTFIGGIGLDVRFHRKRK